MPALKQLRELGSLLLQEFHLCSLNLVQWQERQPKRHRHWIWCRRLGR